MHFMRSESSKVALVSRRADQVVAPSGIVPAEDIQGDTIEGARIPLAFDNINFVAAPRQHKIHLMSLFVAPIAHGCIRKMRLQLFENQVLP